MKTLQDIYSLEQFDHLEWVSGQVVEGFITGMHNSPYHGFSVEFAEHRLYNKGESTKHIDWKLYARTDKLFVKRYQEETNLRCMVVIDTSSSMLFPFQEQNKINKLNFSVYSAAALIYLMRKQRDAVGLTLFSNEIELKTEVKLSETHAKLLYSELYQLIDRDKSFFNKTTNARQVLHQIADGIHKRSLVVLFADMFSSDIEELFSAIEHLRYNKHEVVLFHVTDKQQEEKLDYSNRPIKFVDMETGAAQKLNPGDIRKNYQKAYGEFMDALRLRCGQYQVELVEADVNSDFRDVLVPFLVKRKALY